MLLGGMNVMPSKIFILFKFVVMFKNKNKLIVRRNE